MSDLALLTLKVVAWFCAGVGLAWNLYEFLGPGTSDYPMAALTPALMVVALSSIITWQKRKNQRERTRRRS